MDQIKLVCRNCNRPWSSSGTFVLIDYQEYESNRIKCSSCEGFMVPESDISVENELKKLGVLFNKFGK